MEDIMSVFGPMSVIKHHPNIESSTSIISGAPSFIPTPSDALKSRFLLQHYHHLPIEVVDTIIDEAEYWPCIKASTQKHHDVSQDRDVECVRTPPLCWDLHSEQQLGSETALVRGRLFPHCGNHPVRKIVFSISSHDQGWVSGDSRSRGTYRHSWTWFDAYIVPATQHTSSAGDNTTTPAAIGRNNATGNLNNNKQVSSAEPSLLLPNPYTLQVNRVATHETTHHRIVWHFRDSISPSPKSEEEEVIIAETGRGKATTDGHAVRNMSVGDQVVVWARARFPNWCNYVEKVTVSVFWAV